MSQDKGINSAALIDRELGVARVVAYVTVNGPFCACCGCCSTIDIPGCHRFHGSYLHL
jgi:hypothetical protein